MDKILSTNKSWNYLTKPALKLRLQAPQDLPNHIDFFRIEEITFEQEAPRREAFESVLGSLRIPGINLIYLILGEEHSIHFYIGIAPQKEAALPLDSDDIARLILKPSIEAHFRGSQVKELSYEDSQALQQQLKRFNYMAQVNGLPSIDEDNEDIQGIDRLVDLMFGQPFALMIMASPLDAQEMRQIEGALFELYDQLAPLAKKTVQQSQVKSSSESESQQQSQSKESSRSSGQSRSQSESESQSDSNSRGRSESDTETESEQESQSESKQRSDSWDKTISESQSTNDSGSSKTTSKGHSEQTREGTQSSSVEQKSHSHSKSHSKSHSSSYQHQTSKNQSKSTTQSQSEQQSESQSEVSSHSTSSSHTESVNETAHLELGNRQLQQLLQWIEDILLAKLYYAQGKGGFKTAIYLWANTKGRIMQLGNGFISLFGSTQANLSPLHYALSPEHRPYAECFQLPQYELSPDEQKKQKLLLESRFDGLYWLSTKELSLIAGLPKKEVVGLRLKEEVEFGLNLPPQYAARGKSLVLGHLVRQGQDINVPVHLSHQDLNHHLFITGATGSGKTTTCQRILQASGLPFLVIEPAKTEYRRLARQDDVLVFTCGNRNIAPFYLNPLEFFPGEPISSRADMIKAAIESAFDMEAAIPQIIEAAIYASYKQYGWDLDSEKNHRFEDPFAPGVPAFPTLSDVIQQVEKVVKEQGFDDRLERDYIGSIKARLQSLVQGHKKHMLDVPRSFDFMSLLRRKVILELEEIKNPSEKSFLMGMILVNLNEAIKRIHQQDPHFQHITLVEEAHRLLSRYEPGDSLNQKRGVEAFTDMLAEVRKYGESLIVVDQIPNKLTPEVLKNTHTKIVHRLFALDDKEAVGNTMALNKEQKEFLSRLDTGRAIVFNQKFYEAVQVKIDFIAADEDQPSDAELHQKWLDYYCQHQDCSQLDDVDRALSWAEAWRRFLQAERVRDDFEQQRAYWQQLLSQETDLSRIARAIQQNYAEDRQQEILIILQRLKAGKPLGFQIKKVRL